MTPRDVLVPDPGGSGLERLAILRLNKTRIGAIAVGAARVADAPDVTIAGYTWRLFDIAGAAGAIGLVVAFGAAAVRNTSTLYAAEPIDAGPLAGGRGVRVLQ